LQEFNVYQTIASFAELLLLRISGHDARGKWEVYRMVLLVGSCAALLASEYRLEVKGLETSILAALVAGASRASYTIAAERRSPILSNPHRLNLLLCGVAIVMTTVWLGCSDEKLSTVINAFGSKHLVIVWVNTLATAAAMLLGKSILFPIFAEEHAIPSISRDASRVRDIASILFLVGTMGLQSILTLRRSYTTWVQWFAFFGAVACIGGNPLFRTMRDWRSISVEEYALDSTHPGPAIPLDDYALIPRRFRPSRTSAEGDRTSILDDAEWSTEAERNVSNVIRMRSFLLSVPLFIILAVIWLVFTIFNFGETLLPKPTVTKPFLDLEYRAPVSQEIVISMYKERIRDVTNLITSLQEMPGMSDARVHIYLKDDEANMANIKQLTKADNVTLLPNVGREGETYLHHILAQWDSLAERTFFLQADVHNPREFWPRIRDYYDPHRTGMLSLGWPGNVCNCDSCGDHYGWDDTTQLFPEIQRRINNLTRCENVLLSFKGQFVVSARRIRGIDKQIYQDLWKAFTDEYGWAHQPGYLRGRPDSMSAPQFGFTMERMWSMLFQCSNMDVAWKCPSLLSGWRVGGSRDDCQCYDP
jgi:hypothetical protein